MQGVPLYKVQRDERPGYAHNEDIYRADFSKYKFRIPIDQIGGDNSGILDGQASHNNGQTPHFRLRLNFGIEVIFNDLSGFGVTRGYGDKHVGDTDSFHCFQLW